MNRIFSITFLTVAGVFFFLVGILLFTQSPIRSRASSGTVSLKIAAQGNHKESDKLDVKIEVYNGPNKVFEETHLPFTYQNGSFSGVLPLKSGFNYQDAYALFIKPYKYTGRLFCNASLTGSVCRTPQFMFLTNGNNINLVDYLFLGGDIPPSNGKVDAGDMSIIMKELGKTVSGDAPTDINSDGITDVVDYSLAIYSLSHQAADDQIILSSPLITPSSSLSPTTIATPSPSLTPTSPTITTHPTVTPSPTPTLIPTATAIPTPTLTPTPTPIPRIGKNCSNGTSKVTKSINNKWNLNVLRIPYGHAQYVCVNASTIVLHWSDSPNFSGNGATWNALNSKNVVCGLAIDEKEVLQMSNFYDDKVTWEGCSNLDDSINIEINGTQFDLWYNKDCKIVNPTTNNALANGELQKKKEDVAKQYGVSPSVMDWENPRYVDIMEEQEKKVLETVRYLLLYYDIPKDNVTGHFKLTSSKVDPGPRFLDCIRKKI